MCFRLLFVAMCFAALVEGSVAQSVPEERIVAVDGYLQRLEKLGFAGGVLISAGETTLLSEGYGLANRESMTPWKTTTISTIGSITKQFTGAAILALAEDRRLSVDDPIANHFPSVPADKSAITLHHLLTHSSGIVDLDGLDDFDPINREEFIQRAMEQPLAFEPGNGYQYSNAGYSLLGAIVEQLTIQSYEEFVRERFFLPAGMRDTGYILASFDEERLAQGYRAGKKWGTVVGRPMADDGPYWALRANGGIHSTLEDMQLWAEYLLSGRALSAASMERYWSPHVDEGGGDSSYGYGWVVMDLDGHKVITHNGGNGVHFADMAIVPDSKLVIILQCNVVADFSVANQLAEQIGSHLLIGEELPRVPNRVERTDKQLEPYTGSYLFSGGGTLEVSAEDGELQIAAVDPVAFCALLSTRSVDAARAQRLSSQIDAIVGAWLAGDMGPIFQAYGGRASKEVLANSARRSRERWEAAHGTIKSHRVLGTAFREGRDVTLARIECETGYVDRAYVWDPAANEKLLGVSRRGLDPVLHVLPEVDGGFASWDARSGASRPIRFVTAESGAMEIIFKDPNGSRAARIQ